MKPRDSKRLIRLGLRLSWKKQLSKKILNSVVRMRLLNRFFLIYKKNLRLVRNNLKNI
jgi:hypothetical protein